MPRGRMLLWALLIPVAYAPSFVLGSHPGPTGLVALALCCALALAATVAFSRTRALDRLAARLEPLAAAILLVAIVAYVGLSVAASLHRIARFEHAPMLGLFSQSAWTQLHGYPFANTQESIDGTLGSHFAIHFSPTLLMLVPFYGMWPNPCVLLVAQALAVALALIPLYHLLRPRAGGAAALVFSLGFFALPIFTWAGSRDFHDSSFLPAPLLAATWAMEQRRWGWFALFAVAALGVREDVGLILAALAFYALVRGQGMRVALPVAALGLLWTLVATRVVMPHFGSSGMIMDSKRFFVAMFGQWGATPLQAMRGIVTHPGAVLHGLANRETARYLYTLLRPLLICPPFGDWAALVAMPGLAVNLLSRYTFMRAADLPYSMIPLAFLALATMRLATRVASRSPQTRRSGAALAMSLIVLAGSVPSVFLSLPGREPNLPPAGPAAAVVNAVPAGVPLYAPLALYPALCNREDFDDWESTGPLAKDETFRRRYQLIILWPAGDPPGESRDQALADSLAHDPSFTARPGFDPFLVYERR